MLSPRGESLRGTHARAVGNLRLRFRRCVRMEGRRAARGRRFGWCIHDGRSGDRPVWWREGLCSFIGRAVTPLWSESGKSERRERSPSRRAVPEWKGSAEAAGGNGESAGSGVSSVRTPAAKPCGGMDSDRGPISSAVQFATVRRRVSIASGPRPRSPPGPGGDGSSLTQSRSAFKAVQSLFLHALSFVESPRHGISLGSFRDLGELRSGACGVAPLPPRENCCGADLRDEAKSGLTRLEGDLWLGKSDPSHAQPRPFTCSGEGRGAADESPASRS